MSGMEYRKSQDKKNVFDVFDGLSEIINKK